MGPLIPSKSKDHRVEDPLIRISLFPLNVSLSLQAFLAVPGLLLGLPSGF